MAAPHRVCPELDHHYAYTLSKIAQIASREAAIGFVHHLADHLLHRIYAPNLLWCNAFGSQQRVERGRVVTTRRGCTPHLDPVLSLYHQRWESETSYLELKSTILGGRVLRARTPGGIAQEIYALLVTYQALRIAITDASATTGTTADRASFSIARQPALPCPPVVVIELSRRGDKAGVGHPVPQPRHDLRRDRPAAGLRWRRRGRGDGQAGRSPIQYRSDITSHRMPKTRIDGQTGKLIVSPVHEFISELLCFVYHAIGDHKRTGTCGVLTRHLLAEQAETSVAGSGADHGQRVDALVQSRLDRFAHFVGIFFSHNVPVIPPHTDSLDGLQRAEQLLLTRLPTIDHIPRGNWVIDRAGIHLGTVLERNFRVRWINGTPPKPDRWAIGTYSVKSRNRYAG
ncbi:hypothetical protein [Nocardia sp. NPDC051463]|uniref:hypothetical protein n=1 Tax=Nocardia sp. NPDC051463 TaxID=3154845 RepID=UPI003413F52F